MKWGNTQNLAILHVTTYLVASTIPTLKSKKKNVRSLVVSSFLRGMKIDAKINNDGKPDVNAIARSIVVFCKSCISKSSCEEGMHFTHTQKKM
jgi:hypothetical protein